MKDLDLERELRVVGHRLEFPDPPDIASAVGLRIQNRRMRSQWGRPVAVAILALAALIFVSSATLILSPDARRAVAKFLGVPGVRIQLKDPVVSPSSPQSLDQLRLGTAVTFNQAQQKTSFEIGRPRKLGPPDMVLYRSSPPGGMVTLIYGPTSQLPKTNIEGVGLLLTQFEGVIEAPIFEKMIGSGAVIQQVEVKGRSGFWIEGTPHVLTFRDSGGELIHERTRLAANVLLWERGGVTFRLEGALSKDAAIEIAESVD